MKINQNIIAKGLIAGILLGGAAGATKAGTVMRGDATGISGSGAHTGKLGGGGLGKGTGTSRLGTVKVGNPGNPSTQ